MFLKNSVFISVFLCLVNVFSASACTGCVQLDDYTFDKIISKFDATLVKFDVAFPYGEKHDIYAVLAKEAKSTDNLLIAEVGVKDYGERDNENLAKLYNVKKDDYPVLMLFLKGNVKDPVIFPADNDFTIENLRQFIKDEAGIRLTLPGCIPDLDKLAGQYLSADNDLKQALLQETSVFVDTLKEKEKKTGKVYHLTMQRVIDKGNDFIDTEYERVTKLLRGKITPDKKLELTTKINILKSFSPEVHERMGKDEF